MQLQFIIKFAWVAIPFNHKVSFSDWNRQFFPGCQMSTVFIIGLCIFSFYAVLLVYLWPMYVEIDHENPARFYYPFSCNYWCPRRRNTTNNVNDARVQEVDDQESLLSRDDVTTGSFL